jgi:hypothetical protein
VIGTVEYMAPEQRQGLEVSAATDVYALACVLYESITGHTPFERELSAGSVPALDASPAPISSLRPGLPPALDGVITGALANNPRERPSSCEALLHECREALSAYDAAGPASEQSAAEVSDATVAVAATSQEPAMPAPPAKAEHDESQAAAGQPSGARDGGSPEPGTARGRRRLVYGGLIAALLVAGIVVAVLASSSSTGNAGKPSAAALGQVPTNHVTGDGTATVSLKGNMATVTVATHGLDGDEALAHAIHIHAGGKGVCPPASAARLHNGHLSISTTDGINYYGPPVQALTTHGDTSVKSILVFSRYPTGGEIRYERTIPLPRKVASAIREGNAVVVVHGVDYDHSGIYSGVLERSELDRSVPATATAPALCGALAARRTAATRSGRRSTVYAASLRTDVAALFWCEPDGALAPIPARRPGKRSA